MWTVLEEGGRMEESFWVLLVSVLVSALFERVWMFLSLWKRFWFFVDCSLRRFSFRHCFFSSSGCFSSVLMDEN